VERHGRCGRGRAVEPPGDAAADLGGSLAAEGQDEDLLGREPAELTPIASRNPVDHELDQRRGLAGAGPGEHQERPSEVVDDGLLVGVERRSDERLDARLLQHVLDRHTPIPSDGGDTQSSNRQAAFFMSTRPLRTGVPSSSQCSWASAISGGAIAPSARTTRHQVTA
jgi:hypothetical protein